MAVTTVVKVGTLTAPLFYGSNALRRLEKELGRTTAHIGLILMSGHGGYAELQAILWAGLEGGRLKQLTRPMPYTMDEVGDLMDEMGGVAMIFQTTESELYQALMEAWKSAFPQKPREENKPDPNEKTAAS